MAGLSTKPWNWWNCKWSIIMTPLNTVKRPEWKCWVRGSFTTFCTASALYRSVQTIEFVKKTKQNNLFLILWSYMIIIISILHHQLFGEQCNYRWKCYLQHLNMSILSLLFIDCCPGVSKKSSHASDDSGAPLIPLEGGLAVGANQRVINLANYKRRFLQIQHNINKLWGRLWFW